MKRTQTLSTRTIHECSRLPKFQPVWAISTVTDDHSQKQTKLYLWNPTPCTPYLTSPAKFCIKKKKKHWSYFLLKFAVGNKILAITFAFPWKITFPRKSPFPESQLSWAVTFPRMSHFLTHISMTTWAKSSPPSMFASSYIPLTWQLRRSLQVKRSKHSSCKM